jgi:type II secretory pathway pseudopilin PulG
MTTAPANKDRNGERGAGLVVLLALMTVMTVTMLAVAPSIQQQVQRDRELEEIRRGEEIAEAIRQYVEFNQGAKLPTSMDDLLEGLPMGTKKRQILRPSAAVDLFSEDGKWRLVQVNSKSMQNFARRVQIFFNGQLPTNPEPQRNLDQYAIASLVNIVDSGSEEDKTGSAEDTDDVTEDDTENVPFIAVVSGSKQRSIIAYYGVENHSKWVFTPLFRGSGVRQIGGRSGGAGAAGGFSTKDISR